MALIKRFNTSYTLKSINANDTVTMDTSLVTITGNLIVLGNQTSLSTTNTAIFDNIITLNAGLSPSVAPTLNAGIEVDRGTLANVQLRWNETVKAWQITSDGSAYANIATISGTGSALTAVVQDTAPVLGGNLDIQNYQIYSSTSSYVRINDNVAMATTSVAPTALAGNTVIYTSTAGGGGSGLYTVQSDSSTNELATKSAAIKYSIIFG
jgi:hypothetical protein